MKHILLRPRSFLLTSAVLETKSFTTPTEDLLGAESVLKVHESIMMPNVHRLATAETIPSFELLLQKSYIEIMMRICLGEAVSSLH